MTGRGNAQTLPYFMERIERLEEEKAAVTADIKEVYAEARAHGYDTTVVRQMVRERRMHPEERREHFALCDIYRAELGMLDGSPLGEHARQRLMHPPGPGAESKGEDGDGAGPEAAGPEQPPMGGITPADIDAARAAGGDAAKGGLRVIDNPYTAGDPRRAAWDEGWCRQSGSDGMEIPAAWRRTPKAEKKCKGDGQGDGEASEAAAPEQPPKAKRKKKNEDAK